LSANTHSQCTPFPQKQAEADKKKKEAAAARELKAAKRAAEKAEAEAQELKVRRYVSNQYILLCVFSNRKTIFRFLVSINVPLLTGRGQGQTEERPSTCSADP
jgi:Ribosomal protein L9